MSREIERDDIGGCQLLPGEAPLSPQKNTRWHLHRSLVHNKSRTSHGDLSSWRIKVFAAPVQQLQAIALNESCHLVAQGTGPGSLAPCSTQVLDCFSG